MKRLLICILAIAMMLSSVAFANESAYLNFEEKDEDLILVNSTERIVVQKTNALHLEVKQNKGESIGFVDNAPKCESGKVLKLTNPAKTDAGNLAGFSFASTFQDDVGTTKGTRNNISYGFSFYAPLAVDKVNSNAYFYLGLIYTRVGASEKETFNFLEVKNGEIYPYEERKLDVKPNAKRLADKWYDLRLDIDVANKTIKTYIEDELFYTSYISGNEIDYLRYTNLISVTESGTPCKQEVYVDNFFVNETPECLNKVEYSTCIMNDDFSGNPIVKRNALNNNTAGGIATSVPLFSMIYGEHALSYGSICRFSDRVDRFEYNLVRNTLWGILACIEGIDMEQFRNGTEHLAVTKKVVDFFKEHKKTILYGRICEVPKYNCSSLKIDWEGKCEGSKGGRFCYEETYPAVNAVIWQKSDGKKILLAYNFSDEEKTIELNDVCYNVMPKNFADFDL